MSTTLSTCLRAGRRLLPAACLLAAGPLLAATVSLPTPQGPTDFDSQSFASVYLSLPQGQFACFAGGSLFNCNTAALQRAALGPELETGLTLGHEGQVELELGSAGSTLAIWEAGQSSVASDSISSLVSVRTATGWSATHAYGPTHTATVLNDTQPSGFRTNYGTFSSADFGLADGELFDAVRIRTCCDSASHLDILAVAAITAVPEPGVATMLLAGLFALGVVAPWRRRGTLG